VVNSAGNEGPGNGTDNTLIAPADGDSVIAAGAVTSTGARSYFSSVGPTTDVPARIKPDVMAMGSGVRVASYTNPVAYRNADGTSFSCPLSAGVAALILSANPTLEPLQVREAMRNTADNAASPNNLYGWGILNADSALRYWGIVPMARLSGTVYHDLNGNGVRDGGEPGLAGKTLYLTGLTGPPTDSVISDVDGNFQFNGVAIGSHTVSTDPDSGWTLTTAPDSLAFSLLHRDTVGGAALGLFRPGVLRGTVYDDLNTNGVRDSAESGLAGWTVRLSGAPPDSAVSDSAGDFTLTGIAAGSYTLSQEQHPGWVQSHPVSYGIYPVTVASGFDSGSFDFGNFYASTMAFPVGAGWNLLSLPVMMTNPQADSLYPGALSPVFIYSGGYQAIDTIPNGRGYWVKLAGAGNVLLAGGVRTLDTLQLSAGWNLIGTLSDPVPIASIIREPDSLIASNYYTHTANSYQKVGADSSLLPHRGYWVRSTGDGRLILSTTGAGTQAGHDRIWVGKTVVGGVQCDPSDTFTPPDTRVLLDSGGVKVYDTRLEFLAVCAACTCPAYAAIHYALIPSEDLGKARLLGFDLDSPPSK
ncbi:MAG TPA: S8 family serine peptidase, partial [Bacteroidota bacterium]|nr:S8 family serine peptidase [Bacteroidota bacterium]